MKKEYSFTIYGQVRSTCTARESCHWTPCYGTVKGTMSRLSLAYFVTFCQNLTMKLNVSEEITPVGLNDKTIASLMIKLVICTVDIAHFIQKLSHC